MINEEILLQYARETLEIEISEANRMLMNLNNSFAIACRILLGCSGKVIISGIGKSGHIGKKIAASLASTGTPAFFIHPTEALHGDLGMIDVDDTVIFVSYSGRVYEIVALIPLLEMNNIPIIAITGDVNSPLAIKSKCVLDIAIQREACPMELVPTASAVNALMMGDALTIALMRYRGFNIEQFAKLHPGGKLGAKLLNCVYHVMRTGNHISQISYSATVMDAIFELSRTGLGLTAVCDDHAIVIGVFTDGDLRRWLIRGKPLNDSIEIAMISPVYCISKDYSINKALKKMNQWNISVAPVTNMSGRLVGLVTLHDLQASHTHIDR